MAFVRRLLLFSGFTAAAQAQSVLPRPVKLHNIEAATGTRTQPLYGRNSTGLSLSGQSSFVSDKLGLWDGGGVLTTHRELAGRVQMRNTAGQLNDHATHLAGTLVAAGIDPKARGMAYGAKLQVWDYTNDLIELATAAPNLLLSVHAYGPLSGWVLNLNRPGTDPNHKWEWWGNAAVSSTEDYLFGYYNATAQRIDHIAYQNPTYLMVRSADNKRSETGPPANTSYYLSNTNQQSNLPRSRNDGYDVIPGEATAKNILTIGAADVTLDDDNRPVQLASSPYSGWGPTDDGRIKPDLVGIGTDVYSTVSTNTSAYGLSTGTSMAAANVTGSLLLLQELYARQTSGRFLLAATLRGLAIHTADRLAPANGPDYRQGWGLLNTEAAAAVIQNTNQAHLITEQRLVQGQSWTTTAVAYGGEPLTITLCWTDPEGSVTTLTPQALNRRTPKLINDLDIRVTLGAQTMLPFVLNPDRPADVATRGDNSRDNVEQIYIPNPIAGQTYTIRVSHKNALQSGVQPFSLLVSGRKHSPCTLPERPLLTATDTLICTGATLNLQADDLPGLRYEWLRDNQSIGGATSPVCAVSSAGQYKVRYTDRHGCVGQSAAVRVSVVAPTVQLTPAQTVYLCPEQAPAQLVAAVEAGKGITVNWLRNGQLIADATSQTLTVSQAGQYRAQLTQQGCRTFSQEITARPTTLDQVRLLPADNTVLIPAGATARLQGPTGDQFRYAWYKGGQPLLNASSQWLLVDEPGTYRLKVSQQQCSGWSDEKPVRWSSWAGVTALPDSLLSFAQADSVMVAYPNPTSQTLYIRYVRPGASQVTVDIVDLWGHRLGISQVMQHRQGLFWLDLPVANLMSGQYLLHFTDGDRVKALRFIRE
ncbi:S8 family peptidase [Fibrella sp. WM1]|uniref:S8 family peptidase n=1 Tax=Fibrella musci TaxID=3242485 RepID=UPI0035206993